FEQARATLDPDTSPYEVAEARIGLARIVFQDKNSDEKKLKAAQASIKSVGTLLAPVDGIDARQMAEQGNALYWLIEQKIAGWEKNPASKLERLSLVG